MKHRLLARYLLIEPMTRVRIRVSALLLWCKICSCLLCFYLWKQAATTSNIQHFHSLEWRTLPSIWCNTVANIGDACWVHEVKHAELAMWIPPFGWFRAELFDFLGVNGGELWKGSHMSPLRNERSQATNQLRQHVVSVLWNGSELWFQARSLWLLVRNRLRHQKALKTNEKNCGYEMGIIYLMNKLVEWAFCLKKLSIATLL